MEYLVTRQSEGNSSVMGSCRTESDEMMLPGFSRSIQETNDSRTKASECDRSLMNTTEKSLLFNALFTTEEDMEEFIDFAPQTDVLHRRPFGRQDTDMGQVTSERKDNTILTAETLDQNVPYSKSAREKNMLCSNIPFPTYTAKSPGQKRVMSSSALNHVASQISPNILTDSKHTRGELSLTSSQKIGSGISSSVVNSLTSHSSCVSIPDTSVVTESLSYFNDVKVSSTPSLSRYGKPVDNSMVRSVKDLMKTPLDNTANRVKESYEIEKNLCSSKESSISPDGDKTEKASTDTLRHRPFEFRNYFSSFPIIALLPEMEEKVKCQDLNSYCYKAALFDPYSKSVSERHSGGKMPRKRQHNERISAISQNGNEKKTNAEKSNVENTSTSGNKRNRYDKTADALKQSGLMELTMKTAELLQKNATLQKELKDLKKETSLFVKSVLKNPQNAKLRDFLIAAKRPILFDIVGN